MNHLQNNNSFTEQQRRSDMTSTEDNTMSDGSCSGIVVEPTPLSEVVHCQHLLNQQQQLLQFLLLQEQFRYTEIHSPPNNRNSKRRRGRRVAFSPEVMVYWNPRELDEILTSWYTKDELALFKGERKIVIRALKQVNFDLSRIDQSVHHLRGLEAYLSVSFNKLMQRKRTEVLRTVMTEQAVQCNQGRRDPEALRNASCGASEWARVRASELGEQDAQSVGTSFSAYGDSWGNESFGSQAPSLCSTNSGSSSSSGGEPLEADKLMRQPLAECLDKLPTVSGGNF